MDLDNVREVKERCWKRIEFATEPLARGTFGSWRQKLFRAKPLMARCTGSIVITVR